MRTGGEVIHLNTAVSGSAPSLNLLQIEFLSINPKGSPFLPVIRYRPGFILVHMESALAAEVLSVHSAGTFIIEETGTSII